MKATVYRHVLSAEVSKFWDMLLFTVDMARDMVDNIIQVSTEFSIIKK